MSTQMRLPLARPDKQLRGETRTELKDEDHSNIDHIPVNTTTTTGTGWCNCAYCGRCFTTKNELKLHFIYCEYFDNDDTNKTKSFQHTTVSKDSIVVKPEKDNERIETLYEPRARQLIARHGTTKQRSCISDTVKIKQSSSNIATVTKTKRVPDDKTPDEDSCITSIQNHETKEMISALCDAKIITEIKKETETNKAIIQIGSEYCVTLDNLMDKPVTKAADINPLLVFRDNITKSRIQQNNKNLIGKRNHLTEVVKNLKKAHSEGRHEYINTYLEDQQHTKQTYRSKTLSERDTDPSLMKIRQSEQKSDQQDAHVIFTTNTPDKLLSTGVYSEISKTKQNQAYKINSAVGVALVNTNPTHIKGRRYQCDYCNLSFRYQSRLQRHVGKDHVETSEYKDIVALDLKVSRTDRKVAETKQNIAADKRKVAGTHINGCISNMKTKAPFSTIPLLGKRAHVYNVEDCIARTKKRKLDFKPDVTSKK